MNMRMCAVYESVEWLSLWKGTSLAHKNVQLVDYLRNKYSRDCDRGDERQAVRRCDMPAQDSDSLTAWAVRNKASPVAPFKDQCLISSNHICLHHSFPFHQEHKTLNPLELRHVTCCCGLRPRQWWWQWSHPVAVRFTMVNVTFIFNSQ